MLNMFKERDIKERETEKASTQRLVSDLPYLQKLWPVVSIPESYQLF